MNSVDRRRRECSLKSVATKSIKPPNVCFFDRTVRTVVYASIRPGREPCPERWGFQKKKIYPFPFHPNKPKRVVRRSVTVAPLSYGRSTGRGRRAFRYRPSLGRVKFRRERGGRKTKVHR